MTSKVDSEFAANPLVGETQKLQPTEIKKKSAVKFNWTPKTNSLYDLSVASQQEFTVKSESDTVLEGRQGVRLYVPSGCFDSNSKNVKVIMKEYLEYPDMIKAGLTTTSNGQMLESGGMIHLTALDENENVSIANGKSIKVFFPEGNKEGMQLFYGVEQNGVLNWIPVKTKADSSTSVPYSYETSGQWKPSSTDGLSYYYYAHYETTVLREDENIDSSSFENSKMSFDSTLLARVSYFNRLQDVLKKYDLVFTYIVNENGKPENFRMKVLVAEKNIYGGISVTRNRRIANCFSTLRSVMRSMPKMVSSGSIRQGFKLGKRNVKKQERSYRSNGYYSDASTQKFMDQSAIMYEQAMDITQLGWINCDHFINEKNTGSLMVKAGKESNMEVKAIFKNIKSVMNLYADTKGIFHLNNVPLQSDVMIVVTKFVNGEMFYAVTDQKVNNNLVNDLKFKPYNKEEWESYFEQLNS